MKKYYLLSVAFFSFLASAAQSPLTLEDIWSKPTFSGKSVAGYTSMKDGEHYSAVQYNADNLQNYLVYSFATGMVTDTIALGKKLVPVDSSNVISPESFVLSNDEERVLFETEPEAIYRHSSLSSWFVYDRITGQLKPVSNGGKQQVPAFSPDNNKIAFVRSNNIFYRDLITGKEIQVTTDGQQNVIINGIADWVYQEEFAFVQAYQWSPDGKYIAYYRFDESEVPEYTVQYFTGLYPENYTYKYPKVGEKNAVVSIHIYEVASGNQVKVDLGTETNQYVPRIKWTLDATTLCVFRMNRWQNTLELLLADVTSGKTKLMYKEVNDRYLEINNHLTFFNANNNFIWMSERDGYNHLYIGNVSDGKLTQVTRGTWDVTDFYGMDEKSKQLFYQSAEVSPMERYVYAVSFDGKKKRRLSPAPGWNEASFNNTFTYMMIKHSSANMPADFVLYGKKGEVVRQLEDNNKLKEKLKQYPLSKKEFFSFTTSEGVTLNGWMIKPWNFDSTGKYPVFMTEYGGPGSQKVLDQWGGSDYLFHQYLAQEGYMVACIDNRGTGARGEEFRKMTYLQLGKYETIDQIEGAKYLGTLPFVDAGRIGIFGWSYGGYLSALCMELGADIFKAGISVAPVTDWRYYDSVYTERYMRDGKENESGYVNGSPVTYAGKIKGNFLLIAGLADDNVHYQNTAVFIKKLYENNVQFDQMTFPDKNHSIRGGNTRYYLYTRMTSWIKEHL
ncbi:MAG: S9 family peptidase [Chitinophagaceae bacterium]|nr:S9 family peptidase [Chitinophagaceae bacterium]